MRQINQNEINARRTVPGKHGGKRGDNDVARWWHSPVTERRWKATSTIASRGCDVRGETTADREGACRRRRGGYVKGPEGGNVCMARDRRRYLDTVKRIHDAMLHDPSDGTGRHVYGHGTGRQALVVVFIHDHGGERGPSLVSKVSAPQVCRHGVAIHSLVFSSPFSYRAFPLSFSICPSPVLADSTFALPIRGPRSISGYRHGSEDDGTPREQVAKTNCIRTARGRTLHARRHVIACVDRFLMGLYRGTEEAWWPAVSCPRRARVEYPFLPAVRSFRTFLPFV